MGRRVGIRERATWREKAVSVTTMNDMMNEVLKEFDEYHEKLCSVCAKKKKKCEDDGDESYSTMLSTEEEKKRN